MARKTYSELQEWHEEFTRLRWEFHANPELSLEEHWTSDKIAQCLKTFGVDLIERGIGGMGIVATIHGRNGAANDPDRAVALRCDIDALPIHEETGLPYASKVPGKMHACGHDGHMAGLLMAAKYLALHRRFSGSVHLIFQPAEEEGDGAQAMIRDGLFEKFPVKSIWGMHNWPKEPLGVFMVNPGPMLASADNFDITVTGKAGHAAYPQFANDPVLAASHLVIALQSIVSRNIDPITSAIISITSFHAGETHNSIAEKAELQGTFRTHEREIRDLVLKRIREICDGIAAAFQVQINLRLQSEGCPAVLNTPKEAALSIEAAKEVPGAHVRPFTPIMGAEDFGFMLQKIPGCLVILGTGKTGEDPGLHDPCFNYNDAALPFAAQYWINIVERTLPL